ncbi:redoxin family protein [Chitinophaga sp. 212800010-3]|uniref:TlpA family protein disulfide reductase n=1 Tax=unclassified Chitinophaga TaxID=2619133 RepID=UPI002DF17B72|nr:hypothetical protein [Chitinophaga sp. 212800010-3]
MKGKITVVSILAILLAILFYEGTMVFQQKKSHANYIKPIVSTHIGEPVPNIELLSPESSVNINIKKITNQLPTVLFYFSPYCPYCQAEIEEIVKNIKHLKEIQFFLITPYSLNELKIFYTKNNLSKYKNIVAGVDYNSSFQKYFDAQIVPYLAIYKHDKLKGAFIGNMPYRQIAEETEK